MKSFLTSFVNKKKSTSVEIDINLNQLEKYSHVELVEYIKQYENNVKILQNNSNDQQTMIDELNKEKALIMEENQNFLENKDMYADDAISAMLKYQKLMDANDSLKYLQNFAKNIVKTSLNLDDGTVLENDIEKISQQFKNVSSKFENINSELDNLILEKEGGDFLHITKRLKIVDSSICKIKQFFDDDIEVINDNISMIIERFDSLCDE